MQQCAGERAQVEKFLALAEVLDFDGSEGDFAVTKQRQDLGEMVAGANQNSNAIFAASRARVLDGGKMLRRECR